MMPLPRFLPAIFLFSAVSVIVAPTHSQAAVYRSAQADTLTTKNYKVTITRNCPEGSVTCDNVSYTGVNIKTGSTIRLRGKTMHGLCADGKTPCRFEGYQFRNRNVEYLVSEGGTLRVYQNKKLILEEQGTWKY
jgi:hypothetical protein